MDPSPLITVPSFSSQGEIRFTGAMVALFCDVRETDRQTDRERVCVLALGTGTDGNVAPRLLPDQMIYTDPKNAFAGKRTYATFLIQP